MKPRYIIIIWHQAGGRNNNEVYYVWANPDESARVFSSKVEAREKWRDSPISEIHVGTVMEITAENREWI